MADVEVEEERPLHLRDYVAIVRRHLRLASSCFATALVLTLLVTVLTPRRYTASTRLQLGRQSAIQLRLADNVLDAGEVHDRVELGFIATQVAALRSRDLAERVVRRYGLDESDLFRRPARYGRGPLPLTSDMPEGARPRGLAAGLPIPGADGSAGRPVDPEVLDRYMRWLSVQEVPGTDVVEVAFVTPSPSLSAFLAAAHANAYVDANQDVRHDTDTVAKGFLGRKLSEARRHVRHAETALSRFAAGHPNVAIDREHRIEGQRAAELSTLLTKAEAVRVGLESRYDFLTKSSPNDPLAYFFGQSGVEKVRAALHDVRAQLATLESQFGEKHPRMVELRALERQLDEQLRSEAASEVASLRAHYAAAREREERIRHKLAQQELVGTELNRLGARYELLHNDVETARNLHTSLLKQQMATAVNSDLAASNVRVIERAEVPRRSSRPRIPMNLAFGLVGGLVVSIGAAFAREYFDPSIKSSGEMERLLRLPTLATIPRFPVPRWKMIGHQRGAMPEELVVLRDPASHVAEAFRTVRTAVLCAATPTPPRLILITSARAAEGKTVTSLNLATVLAQSGVTVLLVEADLRHPRCHRALGVPCSPGLSEFLAGQTGDLHRMIRPVGPQGLFFLPAGAPLPSPAELVGSERMRSAFRDLRARYDFVLVDTPPALPVTDAVALAREADGVLLVVKGQETPRELVRCAHDRLVHAGARFVGVIVNNVDHGWGDVYLYDAYSAYLRSDDGTDGTLRSAPGKLRAMLPHGHGWRPACVETAAALKAAARRIARPRRQG